MTKRNASHGAISPNTRGANARATMRKIAAVSCAVSMCWASGVFATDLTTQAPQQEEISQIHPVSNLFRAWDNNLSFSATGAACVAG